VSETPEYTEDDLKDAASVVFAALVTDVDRVRVAELIADEEVTSLAPQDAPDDVHGVTWSGLLEDEGDETPEYTEAAERVHGLVTKAADVSEWAVNLGASGMTPLDAVVDIVFDGAPGVRLMFAINPEVIPLEHRNKVVARLAAGLAEIAL
jgi:hypothetical protein